MSAQNREKREELRVKFIEEMNLQNIQNHPVVVLFVEKFAPRKYPIQAVELRALRVELLRLLSRQRRPHAYARGPP